MGCCSSQADRHNDVLVEEGLEKSQQHCGETDYADIERWQRTDESVRGLTQAQINYYYFLQSRHFDRNCVTNGFNKTGSELNVLN